MNELKPEDVMKALELCNTPRSGVCKICPYHEFGASCHTKRNADALALIRELTEQNLALGGVILKKDAEIERLTSAWKQQNKQLSELAQQYHQRGKDIISQYDGSASMMIYIIRNEAITEFAERLKASHEKRGDLSFKVVSFETIDQIAKEMKGETDERSE